MLFGGGDVVMTCGAAGGLNIFFKSILEAGDEVIVFAPYFPEYMFYIDNHGGVPVVAGSDASFQPDIEDLERRITPRTRAVLVNSPNNPSGAVYPAEVWKAIGEVLGRAEARHGRQIYLVSDEAYAKLTFDGVKHAYVYAHHSSSVGVVSYSKDLSLPGERIGYVAVSPQCPDRGALVDALVFCNRVLGFVNAPALMQHLVRVLLDETVDVTWYQQRRDRLYEELTRLGFSIVKPQGAFYMYPQSPLSDDVAFIQEMQRYNVLVVPGSGFGTPGFFRISYSVDDRVLEGALKGFTQAAQRLGMKQDSQR
jgi:aspartate aminotransferase